MEFARWDRIPQVIHRKIGSPPGLHLDTHQGTVPRIERHDVQLAIGRPVVPGQYLIALPFQVRRSGCFSRTTGTGRMFMPPHGCGRAAVPTQQKDGSSWQPSLSKATGKLPYLFLMMSSGTFAALPILVRI